ncbi:MAG: aminofutalosine synthase MqnE [Deltaproteobacteria bacterium]|nr:aminofutalosine synthase MqnE [Deltaproteobacteria bacterium]
MSSLASITAKVRAGERLCDSDALFLFESQDLLGIGELAAFANARRNGCRVFYNVNRHINYSNICANRCRFCAFRRDPGEEGAYLLPLQEIRSRAEEALSQGATEIHMVGGLHPELPFPSYGEMLQMVKAVSPGLHLKAFTAVEIDHFSRISGLSLREVLLSLKESGLDSLPGGGAEIFAPAVRNELCEEKISGDRWLEVMEEAHRCGLRSNATMLYGHLESYADRGDHLSRLRELQDRTGGFQAFVPLPFQPLNTRLQSEREPRAGGLDDLKTVAIARLYLDNFNNIKAYWVLLGEKIAQVALAFGANDLDGTVVDERIGHEAGAESPRGMTREEILRLIRSVGKEPVERDSLYHEILSRDTGSL